eukprot:CAMPEP_0176001334 /NCGR_PEP_ID=MMETSP0120_2-20121206/68_1 /TAXON_ID=160619 /ORGANISM="Kryptoperidinium foliaceum, Strain CCMP 1326" /LENGTH=219 /DNA_ID=CAMNT_0017333869 /DNA_START=199 /DNA_END=855 /DNA_ORIENTATION=-
MNPSLPMACRTRLPGIVRGVATGSFQHKAAASLTHRLAALSETRSMTYPRFQVASLSTESSSKGGIRGWMEDRNQRKQQEEYMAQMKRLSEMDQLTLEIYKGELERGLNQWGANISFLQTKEVKTAKEVVAVVKALIDVKGGDATADDLLKMDRLERLKVATASSKTVEEIAILMSQIQNMDLMQRTLRKRHLEGKPIPPDPASMQAAIKKDALAVMSK